MNPVLDQQRDAIRQLCQRFWVQRLELFGSAATETFDAAHSDLDFLVEFQELPAGKHADAYFGLLEALQDLFERDVDLVETQAIDNPFFLKSVNAQRMILYAA